MDIKTRPLYLLSTRDPPQKKGHIQTESEGLPSPGDLLSSGMEPSSPALQAMSL